MRKLIIVSSVVVLSACSGNRTADYNIPFQYAADIERAELAQANLNTAALNDMVKCWKEDLTKVGVEYETKFSKLNSIVLRPVEEGTIGKYYPHSRTIVVDPKVFKNGFYSSLGTVYHELGHAVFRLEHAPTGIMRDKAYTEDHYKNNWTNYMLIYTSACKKYTP